jgi:hypothetical protein
LKIAGVVNNYKEALDIEDIVKVFVVEKKILNLHTLRTTKRYKKMRSTDKLKNTTDTIHFSKNYHKKNLQTKNNEGFKPVFNVRGLF